jgi:hypothetical protein
MNKKETFLALSLVVIAVFCRLIPHLPNFVPITAIALFAGRYFNRWWAYLIPIGAMLITDYFLGFSDVTFYVYFSLILAALIGLYLQSNFSWKKLAAGTLLSSILFFVITNFGVWQAGWYGHTLQGLILCYELALPFFRNSLIGDILYTGAIFGTYELLSMKLHPKTHSATSA